uniref:Uncharacterized protein n=1 Tax=Triticum urartu TaxID=4572 RepID=A0A8R7TDL9_TRIUA
GSPRVAAEYFGYIVVSTSQSTRALNSYLTNGGFLNIRGRGLFCISSRCSEYVQHIIRHIHNLWSHQKYDQSPNAILHSTYILERKKLLMLDKMQPAQRERKR